MEQQASVEALAQAWLQAIKLLRSCTITMALDAIAKLEVMDILAENEGRMLSAAQIIQQFRSPIAPSTSPQAAAASLDRILRALASHGLLLFAEEPIGIGTGTGFPASAAAAANSSHDIGAGAGAAATAVTVYGMTAPGSLLLGRGEASLQPLHELDDLHCTVLEGTTPFVKLYGLPLFPFIEQRTDLREPFNRSVAAGTALLVPAVLQAYSGFAHITGTLVDVGGSTGDFLHLILSAHPHIKSINYDQDCVIATAPEFPGIEHVGGDMLEWVPHGDAIVMKLILHYWSDKDCLKILKNCYEALPREGKVIVVERLLPSKVECSLRAQALYQLDLYSMAITGSGKERTFKEFEHLAKAGGFQTARMMCDLGAFAVIELYKK